MSKEQLQYVFDLIRKESKGLRKEMDDNDSIVGEGYLEEIMQRVEYEAQFKPPPIPVPTIQNPFPSRLPSYSIEQVNNNLSKPPVTPTGSSIPSTPSVNRPVNPSITPPVNPTVTPPVNRPVNPTITQSINPTVTPSITPIVNRFPNRPTPPEEIIVAPRGEIPSIIITPKSSSKDLSTIFKIKKSRKCRKCGCGLGKEHHEYVNKRYCKSTPPNPEDAQEEEDSGEDGEEITDENVRSDQDDDVNDSAEENNEEEEEEDYHTHEHSSSDNDEEEEESEPDAPSPPPPKKSSEKPPKKKKKTSNNEESM